MENEVIKFVKSTDEFECEDHPEEFVKRMTCKLYHFRSNCPTDIHYKHEYFDLDELWLDWNIPVCYAEEKHYVVVWDKNDFRLYKSGDEYAEWCWIVSVPCI